MKVVTNVKADQRVGRDRGAIVCPNMKTAQRKLMVIVISESQLH